MCRRSVVCIPCVCVCGSGLSLSLCVFCWEVGGLSWCHWVQQADPERGPLLAAVARVVPVPQKHTHTGDRREEWHRWDFPASHSTDTSTSLASLWTKPALFGTLLFLTEVELSKSQGGGKKTWRRSEEKVGRLCRTAFSVSDRREENKRVYSSWKDRGKENKYISAPTFWIGALSPFVRFFFSCVWFFFSLLLDTCRGVTFWETSDLNSKKVSKREGKESKWKCWRYAWNWWGVNLRKASRPPPAVTWKVRIFCDGCCVIS